MASSVRRRSTTAVGVYAATVLGVGTTVAATRILGDGYAAFAVVFSIVGFFQMLLDLTVDEALIKYGFRYVTGEDWGRLKGTRSSRGAPPLPIPTRYREANVKPASSTPPSTTAMKTADGPQSRKALSGKA